MAQESKNAWLSRAQAADRSLRERFGGLAWRRAPGVLRDAGWHGCLGAPAHLWPQARAIVAGLDLAGAQFWNGVPCGAAERLRPQIAGLARYWDGAGPVPAYASAAPPFGDRFLDDNAWVALGLLQAERMRRAGVPLPDPPLPDDAAAILHFAERWWDRQRGGTFWLEQGRGRGRRNHDRNLVSTAPTAAVALHLAELGMLPAGPARAYAERALGWILDNLDAGGNGRGPFWDKVRGDGSIDHATWSYNQGNVAGLRGLLGHDPDTARVLAGAPLASLRGQPPAFNAILLRNLLRVDGGSPAVRAAAATYAETLWTTCDRRGLASGVGGRRGLLEQSALVSLCALLAWPEEALVHLA